MISEKSIGLATINFGSWFTHLSNDIAVIDDSTTDVDVVIFTGGEDISPRLYNEEPDLCRWWSDERDAAEIAVLNRIYHLRTLNTRYVIGVCRGVQMLNAYFGGTLYQDLQEKSHGGGHSIHYLTDVGALANMTLVNSMHHQAVKELAPGAEIIAVEPVTDVIEIVNFHKTTPTWGTQFHPEAFDERRSSEFFDLLLETMEVGV